MNTRKLSDHKFDLSKTVLLCCKGPSSVNAPQNSEGKYVAVTTSACNIFEHCDFLFSNDVEFFRTGDISNVENVVVPLFPHLTRNGRAGIHTDVPPEDHFFASSIGDQLAGKNVYTYRLFTQSHNPRFEEIKIGDDVDTISLPFVLTGYHTALYWLITAGFKRFEIYGVTEDGGYNDSTVNKNIPKVTRTQEFFKQNFDMGISILQNNDCDYTIL